MLLDSENRLLSRGAPSIFLGYSRSELRKIRSNPEKAAEIKIGKLEQRVDGFVWRKAN